MNDHPIQNAPIGIFDSGPGGLAVLKEVRRLLPHEDVLYLGDTARQPFELRPKEEVCQISLEITGYLISQGVKLIIIGCNTASVASLEAIHSTFSETPVLGMIEPGVRTAIAASQNQRYGVLGSIITVQSQAYDTKIKNLHPEAAVLGVVPTDLFRYTEKGLLEDQETLKELVARYTGPLMEYNVGTVILGCTDLTCVRDLIEDFVGDRAKVVDPAEEVVIQAGDVLEKAKLMHEAQRLAPNYRFIITGDGINEFADYTRWFVDLPNVNVRKVDLEELKRPTEHLEFDCAKD